MGTEEDICHLCQQTKTPHNGAGHNWGVQLKSSTLRLYDQDDVLKEVHLVPWEFFSKSTLGGWRQMVMRNMRRNNHGWSSPWIWCTNDNIGCSWHQEIQAVAKKGWPKGQHRGTNHGSTMMGPKHQIHGGRSLTQLTELNRLTVQRCPGDYPALCSGMCVHSGTRGKRNTVSCDH